MRRTMEDGSANRCLPFASSGKDTSGVAGLRGENFLAAWLGGMDGFDAVWLAAAVVRAKWEAS